MTTHREGSEISRDQIANGTDVYAFVSPDRPDQVTLIASFTQEPALSGASASSQTPAFGDDVLYEIHVSNRPGARADVTYQFRFHTKVRTSETLPATTGRPQFYAVSRLDRGHSPVLLRAGLTVTSVGEKAVHALPGDCQVFAGQRAAGPRVGLGAIFGLGAPCPAEIARLVPSAGVEVRGLRRHLVQTIAIQMPVSDLTRGHVTPTQVMHGDSVIGVWASASRQKSRIYDSHSERTRGHGPFVQVSRLGNPLFSELIVPDGDRARWHAEPPRGDDEFARYVSAPELARVLPILYAGGFPNLAAYTRPRADLIALLLTGIPTGVIGGFQNFTGSKQADMLRLNLAVAPTSTPSELGLLAGDPAGFPNGRRVDDDVLTVQLRAIAGLTIPLVDSTFTADVATSAVAQGRSAGTARSSSNLGRFPYLGPPGGDLRTTPLPHAHAHSSDGQAGPGRATRRARQTVSRQSRNVSAVPAAST